MLRQLYSSLRCARFENTAARHLHATCLHWHIIYIYIYIHTHTYIYIYIYTHTHTRLDNVIEREGVRKGEVEMFTCHVCLPGSQPTNKFGEQTPRARDILRHHRPEFSLLKTGHTGPRRGGRRPRPPRRPAPRRCRPRPAPRGMRARLSTIPSAAASATATAPGGCGGGSGNGRGSGSGAYASKYRITM